MYAIQALWSAAQNDVDLAVIIVNNARYEALIGFARSFGLQQTVGTRLPEIDFVRLAQGQGLPAERVETIEGLDAALAHLFAAKGPRLLEVVVD
ncbi:MAG: thiamine pyrophosphate-dependent enzyme [Sphingomonas sp.]